MKRGIGFQPVSNRSNHRLEAYATLREFAIFLAGKIKTLTRFD